MCRLLIFLCTILLASTVLAKPNIAVLTFQLDDMTQLPNTPAELTRTASFKPLLEQQLKNMGYDIIQIDATAEQRANAGVEYLLQHDDSSADLGQQFGADWIIVAKHRKPSFLYSHLMVHVIPVKKRHALPPLLVELKGNNQKVTEKSIHFLAEKIQTLIKTDR